MRFRSADEAARTYLSLRYDTLPVVRAIDPGERFEEPV
jgi:hypothetical protein